MKTNNLFSIKRFGLLFRQNMIHNYKLIALSLLGFCGVTFILLLLVHASNDFQSHYYEEVIGSFIFLFIAVGIIYTGTAFPGLRTKEKSYSFLLVPSSTFEKFLLEFLTRIIVFVVAMPIVFWLVYMVEGYFVQLIVPGFSFSAFPFNETRMFPSDAGELTFWIYALSASIILLIFNIPLTGTTIFMKYPLLKTLFAVAVIIFFHVFLVFFFIEILNFKEYGHREMSILFIKDEKDVFRFFTTYSIIFNIALIAAGYLKLKEKEV